MGDQAAVLGTLAAVVGFASQRADGASWSLVMSGTQAVLTVVVFALAVVATACVGGAPAVAAVGTLDVALLLRSTGPTASSAV